MSEIRVTTISDTAGTGPVELTKQIAPKVFVCASSSFTISNSFNVSSITDQSTGRPTVNLTSAMSATVDGQSNVSGSCYDYTFIRLAGTYMSASSIDVLLSSDAGVAEDAGFNIDCTGDLA